jgi:hypothetical protein
MINVLDDFIAWSTHPNYNGSDRGFFFLYFDQASGCRISRILRSIFFFSLRNKILLLFVLFFLKDSFKFIICNIKVILVNEILYLVIIP